MLVKKLTLTLSLIFIFTKPFYSQWSTNPAENTRVSNWGFVDGAVTDGEGGAIIAYHKLSYHTGRDLYIQRIDSSGYLKWGPERIVISEERYYQFYAPYEVDNMRCIVSDGAGGAYFSYIDYQRSVMAGWLRDSCDVFVQHIDKDGNLLWGDVGIQLNPKGISGDMFALLPDGSGNIIACLLYTSPSPRDLSTSRMPSSA